MTELRPVTLCEPHPLQGTGPRGRELLALLESEGPMRFMEIHEAINTKSKAQTMNLLLRLMRYGLVERVQRGIYMKAAA